jgi:hypothetical protein
METPLIRCTKCSAELSSGLFAGGTPVLCGTCGSTLTAYLFPALSSSTLSAQAPENLLTDSQASCFYHPGKKAVIACAGCGRFLCGLCDLEWQDQHLCSSCLASGKKKGKIKNLENHRVLYDQITFSLSLVPLLMWPVTCLTAPMTLYMAARYWNAPTSLLPRTKYRFVLAVLIALVEIALWAWFLAIIFHVISIKKH